MIKGFKIPKVIFRVREGDASNDEEICAIGGKWTDISSNDLFKGKRVILFSLPGAFTPTCSSKQLPGFEKNADKFWGINERFNRLRIEIEIPIETSKDWITDSKNQVNIPGYAYSKIRKCLIQIRKDYLEKANLMNGENKMPVNKTQKKKNELIRMLRNSVLNEEELFKIEKSIKELNE